MGILEKIWKTFLQLKGKQLIILSLFCWLLISLLIIFKGQWELFDPREDLSPLLFLLMIIWAVIYGFLYALQKIHKKRALLVAISLAVSSGFLSLSPQNYNLVTFSLDVNRYLSTHGFYFFIYDPENGIGFPFQYLVSGPWSDMGSSINLVPSLLGLILDIGFFYILIKLLLKPKGRIFLFCLFLLAVLACIFMSFAYPCPRGNDSILFENIAPDFKNIEISDSLHQQKYSCMLDPWNWQYSYECKNTRNIYSGRTIKIGQLKTWGIAHKYFSVCLGEKISGFTTPENCSYYCGDNGFLSE